MMKLYVLEDHQNKSAAYAGALSSAGYFEARHLNCQGIRFILSDADWRTTEMDTAAARSIPVFLYPHAARPMVIYDGCVTPRTVRCMFTQAPGGKALMEKIGYPNPVEVSGWAFSEVRPFRPVAEVKRICFAPIHPNANGYLNRVDKDLNRKTFERLSGWCSANHVELSIRFIGSLAECGLDGLPEADFITWHQGKKNNSTFDMERADLVVSHQTFAWMAVALGIPTVMMGEDVPPRTGNSEAGFRYVDHWEDYKDYLMYPLDILSGDPDAVIAKAAAGCPAVEEWKQRFIGEPFDGPAFVKTLEAYL